MNTGHRKWRTVLQVILLGGFASLAGCGNSDSPPITPPMFNNPNATMTIETFGVTGTSILNSVIQIEPKSPTTTGLFTVGWTVRGNDTYTARVYISADNVRGGADIQILEGCGKRSLTDACRSNALPVCIFENTNVNTNTISCITPSGSPVVDVTAVIPIVTPIVIPRTSVLAYIIMEACNPNGTCFPTTTAQAIQVRFQ